MLSVFYVFPLPADLQSSFAWLADCSRIRSCESHGGAGLFSSSLRNTGKCGQIQVWRINSKPLFLSTRRNFISLQAVPCSSLLWFPECFSSLPTIKIAEGPDSSPGAHLGGSRGQRQAQCCSQSSFTVLLQVQGSRRKSHNGACRFAKSMKTRNTLTSQGVLFLIPYWKLEFLWSPKSHSRIISKFICHLPSLL